MPDDKNKIDKEPDYNSIFRGYGDAMSSSDRMDLVYYKDIIFPKQQAEYYKALAEWLERNGKDSSRAVEDQKKYEARLKDKDKYLELADPMYAKIKKRLSKEFSGNDLMNALASDRYFEEKYTPALFKALRAGFTQAKEFYKTGKPEDIVNAKMNEFDLMGINPEDFNYDNPIDASPLLGFKQMGPEAFSLLSPKLQQLANMAWQNTVSKKWGKRMATPEERAQSLFAKVPESLFSKMNSQMENLNIGKLTPSQYANQGIGGSQAAGLNLRTAIQETQQPITTPLTGITPPPPSSQPDTPAPTGTGVGGVSPIVAAGVAAPTPGAGGQPNNIRNATRSMMSSRTPSPVQTSSPTQPGSMLTANAGLGGSGGGSDNSGSNLMTFSNMRKDKLKSRYNLQSSGAGWGQNNT